MPCVLRFPGALKIRHKYSWSLARRVSAHLAGLSLFLLASGPPPASATLPEPATVGYRSFYFGPTVISTPTGEKPESKLWWNDGIWWGSLWDTTSNRYEIHRFDPETQSWTSTDTPIDNRPSSKGDALWDGQHLYVVSHIFTTNAGPTVPVNSGRLYRFSYDFGSRLYTPDPGFPVNVNGSKSETLVLEKDSTGRLWVTWVELGKVKVNCSLGDDATWGVPFDLPAQVSDVAPDDISSIVSFSGKVGVLWSDQPAQSIFFAVHLDGSLPNVWEPVEAALADSTLGPVADDHMNVKACDGTVYAVTKTNKKGPPSPLVYVLRRDPTGEWSRHLVGTKAENHTRPILLLDTDADSLHVLATSKVTGRHVIYKKSASVAGMEFPEGLGTPFIDSPLDLKTNNVTSTKQCLNSTTGLLGLASDQDTRYYLHNFLFTPPTATNPPVPGRGSAVVLHRTRPNPFRHSTSIHFELPATGRARIAIYDLGGRLIRRLLDGVAPAGHQVLVWDGRDEAGRPVEGGLYLVRLSAQEGTASAKLVRIW